MKKLLKGLMSVLLLSAAAVGTCVPASAEDVTIDVSEAVESTGWGQSVTILKAQFDAERITKDSVVKVAFDAGDYDGEELPIELIFQSWNNTTSPKAKKDGGVWAKITTDDYTEKTATFTYDAIIEAYGTDDLSEVQAICVGDTDKTPVTCKSIIVTNCSKAKATIDISIDCSEAKRASTFGQSMVVRYDNFDTTTLTSKSKIVVGYEIDKKEKELTKAPVSIAIQSWENSNSPLADEEGKVWETVEPESYGDGVATFSYEALVDAYGTADFTRVSALNFCDNGEAILKVTSINITDCMSADKGTHISEEEASDDSEISDSSEGGDTTSSKADSKPDAAAAVDDNGNDREKKGSVLPVIIGVVAGVVLAVAVLFIIVSRKTTQEYDIKTGKMVDKKKHKKTHNVKW